MPDYIYVLGMDGKPQMPTKRRRHVQKLLDTGKARIAGHVPFTIQLRYPNDSVLQPVILAEDPGRTNIGVAAVGSHGELFFSAVVETRNREIRKLMDERRAHRRASRNGERKARQRLAKRYQTMLKAGMLMRKLPQYGDDGYITCKGIRNTQARFCNRKRKKGWITPTVEQLVRTHINVVRKIGRILPLTDAALEVNRFAFMQMEDPSVTGIDFQNGSLKGYDDLHACIRELQHGRCLLCGKPITQYHHIQPRSKGGSDTLQNIAGLCDACHERVHKESAIERKLHKLHSGLVKKYAAVSALNQVIPFISKRLIEEFPKNHVRFCTGRDTSIVRSSLGYKKTKDRPLHETDAYCIALTAYGLIPKNLPAFDKVYQIKQFRRQNRALIHAMRERTYYLDGKVVARNRKKRMDQKTDSLESWYQKMTQWSGAKAADSMRSRLTVKKSTRYYNTKGRTMPGAVFLFQGKRYVLSGQHSRGQYFRAVGCGTKEFPARQCVVVRQNEGLVFLS